MSQRTAEGAREGHAEHRPVLTLRQPTTIARLDVTHITDAPNFIKSVIDFTHHTDDSRHDVAMREFARFDGYAAAAVAEIDRRRIEYLYELFKAAHFEPTEALLRAQALYFSQVGEYTTSLTMDAELRDELAERRFRLLIGRAGDSSAVQ